MTEWQYECCCDATCIERIDQAVEQQLLEAGHPRVQAIGFAVHELIINSVEAMRKNGAADAGMHISLNLVVEGIRVTLSLNDWGGGLKTEAPADPDAPLSLEEHGRGLPLIRRFADTFSWKKEEDGSCTYTMIF